MLQYFKGKLSSLLSVLNWKGVLLIKDNMKKIGSKTMPYKFLM